MGGATSKETRLQLHTKSWSITLLMWPLPTLPSPHTPFPLPTPPAPSPWAVCPATIMADERPTWILIGEQPGGGLRDWRGSAVRGKIWCKGRSRALHPLSIAHHRDSAPQIPHKQEAEVAAAFWRSGCAAMRSQTLPLYLWILQVAATSHRKGRTPLHVLITSSTWCSSISSQISLLFFRTFYPSLPSLTE